jgi:hypothetical protein
MPSTLIELLDVASKFVGTFLHSHTVALSIVAVYVLFNAVMFAVTKGREFAWAGYTGALFLLPFIKFT